MDPILLDILTALSEILAVAGALIIFYAGILAFGQFVAKEWRRFTEGSYSRIRADLTHRLILGLDLLIAADIILSVIKPTLEEIILLAVVVGIRTILTLSLLREAKELDFHGSDGTA